MIKKINIFLAICFVVMFAAKGLKQMKKARDSRPRAPAAAEAKSEAASLAPKVYYSYWSTYSVEDPISNRNGILLDIMRAIFPRATFHRLRADVSGFAKVLREDPKAVVVGFGAHPDFTTCLAAPTPLAYTGFVFMTLRRNPWRYSGPESLKGMRVVSREALLDYSQLRALREKKNTNGEPCLRVVPTETSMASLVEMVEKGEADALVTTGVKDSGGIMTGSIPAHLMQTFRMSDEVGFDASLLYVSSVDADYAKQVVDEYEKGLVRIEGSGERRRIFEYYGMSDVGRPKSASDAK